MEKKKRTRLHKSFSEVPSEKTPLTGGTSKLNRRLSSWRPTTPDFQVSKQMMSPASSSSLVVDVDVTRQSSVVTVFAIWNTMMGTSILAMPWAIEQAGLVLGTLLVLFMGLVCLYTAYCNLRSHEQFGSVNGEISELAKTLLGPGAQLMAKIFSIIVLLGANIVYWILMSNFLYYSIAYIHDSVGVIQAENITTPTELCPRFQQITVDTLVTESIFHKIWNLEVTVPIFLSIMIAPILNFKSPTFFTKFNSFGTLSVMYLLIFVLTKSFHWGVNIDIYDTTSTSYTPLIKASFPATSGMLALSFFIHNIIITIMRNNSNQKSNGRDLSIAYGLVTLTYMTVGVIFFVSFPLIKSCINDNFLDNFSSTDIMTVIARVFLLFQLTTVFPLVAYMLRVQTLQALTGRPHPGTSYVIAHNIVLVFICVLFAIFLPRIGTIIRFTGALSGMIHIFTLPCLLRLAAQQRNGSISMLSWIAHLAIPVFGAINLLGQFFVNDL